MEKASKKMISQQKNDEIGYENIRKFAIVQGDDYKTGCSLDFPYFKENDKMIAIVLSKQQALDTDPRAIQQINFTGNFDHDGNSTMFFIIEKTKKLFWIFYKEL